MILEATLGGLRDAEELAVGKSTATAVGSLVVSELKMCNALKSHYVILLRPTFLTKVISQQLRLNMVFNLCIRKHIGLKNHVSGLQKKV